MLGCLLLRAHFPLLGCLLLRAHFHAIRPLVREITFQNGEELTEEGLPFAILFYNPADMHSVQQFSRIVRARMEKYRGKVNFITADGTTFTHPLQVRVGARESDENDKNDSSG